MRTKKYASLAHYEVCASVSNFQVIPLFIINVMLCYVSVITLTRRRLFEFRLSSLHEFSGGLDAQIIKIENKF